jgi:hypothetical protein
MKYAKFQPELKRRETWEELVTRNMNMHIKTYPKLEEEIRENYKFVYDKKVLPSMRSMQFAGKPIEISPNRIYNCAFAPIDDWRVFSEIMFMTKKFYHQCVQCSSRVNQLKLVQIEFTIVHSHQLMIGEYFLKLCSYF